MAKKLIKHTSFTVDAGQAPVIDRPGKRGGRPLRPWQGRGFTALSGKTLRMLLAPTGSGKSTLIKALAVDDLERDPGLRVVIAVPQSLIARSFGDDTLELGQRTIQWSVADGNDLTVTTARTVAALIRFLSSKPAHDAGGRVVVCTHQTLVMAHKQLMRQQHGRKSPWARVSLYIDEAHHSQADDGEDAEKANNQIGKLVRHWLDAAPGPLLLATATWLRGNLLDIIPTNRAGDFTRFVYSMEDHLRSMVHLKQVSFRFLIGNPEDAFRALYAEGHQKTIAWLPPVNSRHVKGAGSSKGETLDRYQAAVGRPSRRDDWTTYLKTKGGKVVRSLDFVTPDGRDQRKARLDAAIDAGSDTPDILWVLGLGKEGFDWPELSRGIVIGDRGSIVDVLQMMGRVLRDHPGKTTAEFIVVLPWEGKADVDVDIVKWYIQTVIAAMVIEWQIGQTKTRRRRASESIADDPAKAAKVIGDVVDAAIRDPRAEERHRELIREALKKNDAPDDDAAIDDVCSLLSSGGHAMALQSKDMPSAVNVEEGVFGGLRGLVATFGYGSLETFREALGARVAWAPVEEVRRRIRGITVANYEDLRHSWGPQYPHSSGFMAIYGMTFAELQGGYKKGEYVNLEIIRERIQGMTRREYASTYKSWGPGYPSLQCFPAAYDMTFTEARDGVGDNYARGRAPLSEVLERADGMTRDEYNAHRATWSKETGLFFPHSGKFMDAYNTSYSAAVHGSRPGTVVSLEDIMALSGHMSDAEHNKHRGAWRRSLGKTVPLACAFRKHYGKTRREARGMPAHNDNNKWADINDVHRRIRWLSQSDYDAQRSSWGPQFPAAGAFRRIYGHPYGQVRSGEFLKNAPRGGTASKSERMDRRGVRQERKAARRRT